jgi:hypothetical protein
MHNDFIGSLHDQQFIGSLGVSRWAEQQGFTSLPSAKRRELILDHSVAPHGNGRKFKFVRNSMASEA